MATLSELIQVMVDYGFQVIFQNRGKEFKDGQYGITLARYGKHYISEFFVGKSVLDVVKKAYKFLQENNLLTYDLIEEVPTHVYDRPVKKENIKENGGEEL